MVQIDIVYRGLAQTAILPIENKGLTATQLQTVGPRLVD